VSAPGPNILRAIGIGLIIVGALFKIQHWPWVDWISIGAWGFALSALVWRLSSGHPLVHKETARDLFAFGMISVIVMRSLHLPGKGSALNRPLAERVTSDISDEFHERFNKVVNEDTSASMLKSSLDATRMVDRRDSKFALEQDDDAFIAQENKIGATLTGSKAAAPVKAMFSEKDEMFDFAHAEPVQKIIKGSAEKLEKLFDEELFIQKVRPEMMSPEAELEKLSHAPKQETKIELPAEGGLSAKEKMDLTGKLEDKLTLTIKELIWEIVPHLAEKIIKEEIDKIKSEVNRTGF